MAGKWRKRVYALLYYEMNSLVILCASSAHTRHVTQLQVPHQERNATNTFFAFLSGQLIQLSTKAHAYIARKALQTIASTPCIGDLLTPTPESAPRCCNTCAVLAVSGLLLHVLTFLPLQMLTNSSQTCIVLSGV